MGTREGRKPRKDGLLQKKITITVNGRKKQKFFYGHSERELNKKILDFKGEVAKGRLFKEVAAEWFEQHGKYIEFYTRDGYKSPLKDVTAEFGEDRTTEITPSACQAFINNLAKKGYARQTVKLRLVVLNLIFKYAIINGELTSNPVQHVEVPKGLRSTRRQVPPDDVVKKIKQCEHLYPLFLLYTGCRPSEALAVRYEDIDFERNLVRINKAVVYEGEAPTVRNKTKTSQSVRDIILLDALKKKIPHKKSGYLFTGKNGIYHRKELRTLWQGFEFGVTQYQLRHFYITMLYEAGIDAETAMLQTGHSNISTMRDIYTHIKNSKFEETAKSLNEFIKSSK